MSRAIRGSPTVKMPLKRLPMKIILDTAKMSNVDLVQEGGRGPPSMPDARACSSLRRIPKPWKLSSASGAERRWALPKFEFDGWFNSIEVRDIVVLVCKVHKPQAEGKVRRGVGNGSRIRPKLRNRMSSRSEQSMKMET